MPVCLLLGLDPSVFCCFGVASGAKESWDEAKKLMADPTKFLESLKSYDKVRIRSVSAIFAARMPWR